MVSDGLLSQIRETCSHASDDLWNLSPLWRERYTHQSAWIPRSLPAPVVFKKTQKTAEKFNIILTSCGTSGRLQPSASQSRFNVALSTVSAGRNNAIITGSRCTVICLSVYSYTSNNSTHLGVSSLLHIRPAQPPPPADNHISTPVSGAFEQHNKKSNQQIIINTHNAFYFNTNAEMLQYGSVCLNNFCSAPVFLELCVIASVWNRTVCVCVCLCVGEFARYLW